MPDQPNRVPGVVPSTRAARTGRAARSPAAWVLLALALLLAGGTGSGCRTPEAVFEPRTGAIPPNHFRATWSVTIDPAVYGTVDRLFVEDDLVIAYTDTNGVYVMSTNGDVRFLTRSVVGPRERLWPPQVIDAGGRLGNVTRAIVFPTNTGFVLFNEEGDRIQAVTVPEALTSRTYSDGQNVFVGLSDRFGGRIARVDPTRQVGAVRRSVLLPGAVVARPTTFQNLMFAADTTGRIYGITGDGAQAWRCQAFETDRPVEADLAVDEFGLYAAGTDSILYCLDRTSGRIRWRFFAERPLYEGPVPTDRYVFQPVPGVGVACVQKTTGSVNREPIWVAEGATRFLSHDSRRVYLLHAGGFIVAHDKQTGEELFRSDRNDYRVVATNPAGERMFAVVPGGQVVGVDPVLTRGVVGTFARATDAPVNAAADPVYAADAGVE